jgi:hypothetical protein
LKILTQPVVVELSDKIRNENKEIITNSHQMRMKSEKDQRNRNQQVSQINQYETIAILTAMTNK